MRKLLAGLLLTLPGAAPAATLIVDTGADTLLSGCTAAPGDCTLRGPITAARSIDGGSALGQRRSSDQAQVEPTSINDHVRRLPTLG